MPGYLTGNEYVSLSRLSGNSCGLHVASVVSFAHKGLLEFVSDAHKRHPLFQPEIFVRKKRLRFEQIEWQIENFWIPVAHLHTPQMTVTFRWVAPPEEKAFALLVDFTPVAGYRFSPEQIEVAVKGSWGAVLHHVNLPKVLQGERRMRQACWSNGVLGEFCQNSTVAAFCLSSSNPSSPRMHAGCEPLGDDLHELHTTAPLSQEVVSCGCEALHFSLMASPLPCAEGAQLAFYVGFGQDEISAVTSAAHLQRMGSDEVLQRTRSKLHELTLQINDPLVSQLVNHNAMFCYYFSVARSLDSEKLCCMTSRSSDYYVSTAYWDRDALFWTFPCILQQDRVRAREILEYAFTTQLRNAGIHSRFLDGTLLEPGMELDQLCAPVIELVHYLRFTNDFTFARERFVQEAIGYLRERLLAQKCKNAFLFRTFLNSTDDVPPYSCITYMNVLAWRFFFDLAFIEERLNPSGVRSVENRNNALRLRREIYTHCIRTIDGEDVFAYAVSMDDEPLRFDPLHANTSIQQELATGLYDDPMGSLVTLPYWGFCKHYDPVYEATLRLLFSQDYRFGNAGHRFAFAGACHAGRVHGPFVASVANRLLARLSQREIHDLLGHLRMDNGLACESICSDTGEVASGAAMASMAGYLAYAAYRGLAKVSSYGMPEPTPEEIAKTEGAIRRAALLAGQSYPRPGHVATGESGASRTPLPCAAEMAEPGPSTRGIS